MNKRKTKVKELKKIQRRKNIKKIKNGVKRNNTSGVSSHNHCFINFSGSSN